MIHDLYASPALLHSPTQLPPSSGACRLVRLLHPLLVSQVHKRTNPHFNRTRNCALSAYALSHGPAQHAITCPRHQSRLLISLALQALRHNQLSRNPEVNNPLLVLLTLAPTLRCESPPRLREPSLLSPLGFPSAKLFPCNGLIEPFIYPHTIMAPRVYI